MSSILKALRKLEADKSVLGEGSVDIGRDILKRSYQQPARRTGVFYLISALLGVVMLSATFWWLVGKETPEDLVNHEQAVAAKAVEERKTPISLLTEQLDGSAAEVETRASTQPRTEALPVDIKPKPKKIVTAAIPVPIAAKPAVSEPVIGEPPPIVLPDLYVEEIAYQQQPSARLAVINDLPVMEGTDIEGARVLEILSDRVRFSFQGIQFEKYVQTDNKQF